MYEREIGLIDDIFKHIIGFDTDVIVAWQTLKAAVLAQQTNNSAIPVDNMLCQCNSNELTYCNAVGRYCDPGKKCLIAQHPFAGR